MIDLVAGERSPPEYTAIRRLKSNQLLGGEMSEDQETFGELRLPNGVVESITALFTLYRDDREVSVCETNNGTIVVSTKSWLKQNDRELVQTVNAYTKESFVMMAETMILGAEYLGIDLSRQAALLHASDDNQIKYEYAGRGEPNFSST